jgi:DNA-binding PadR family transcriptional regulator
VSRNNEGATGLGRFSEPALFVLASLAAGPKHGYSIIDDVERETGRRLGAGTLYGAISRLEETGLIEGLEIEERGRRPYRITAAGKRALSASLDEMRQFRRTLAALSAK